MSLQEPKFRNEAERQRWLNMMAESRSTSDRGPSLSPEPDRRTDLGFVADWAPLWLAKLSCPLIFNGFCGFIAIVIRNIWGNVPLLLVLAIVQPFAMVGIFLYSFPSKRNIALRLGECVLYYVIASAAVIVAWGLIFVKVNSRWPGSW